MSDGSTVTLVNVILTGNIADDSGGAMSVSGGTVSISYSDAWGDTPDEYDGITDPTGTDGNVSVDPGFYDAWHLDSTSALVDAGDPSVLDPDGSASDIGAFGGTTASTWDLDDDGVSAWWLPGVYDARSVDLDCDDTDASVYPGAGC